MSIRAPMTNAMIICAPPGSLCPSMSAAASAGSWRSRGSCGSGRVTRKSSPALSALMAVAEKLCALGFFIVALLCLAAAVAAIASDDLAFAGFWVIVSLALSGTGLIVVVRILRGGG